MFVFKPNSVPRYVALYPFSCAPNFITINFLKIFFFVVVITSVGKEEKEGFLQAFILE